jgi:hypothetical protein
MQITSAAQYANRLRNPRQKIRREPTAPSRVVVVGAMETHRCFQDWILHRSNEVLQPPAGTAATNLRDVPTATVINRSPS